MELDLIGDQELLRDTAAKFMDAICPLDVVRQLSATDTGLPDSYMHDAAELGWFSLLVPAEDGGGSISGDGLRDAAILAEERGRRLQPGPFVPMNVVASALAARGSADQKAKVLPPIMNGEALATWAAADGAGAWPPGNGLSASQAGSRFILSGCAGLAQDAALADWFLVAARSPAGQHQFLVPSSTPGVSLMRRRAHDITQRFASVRLRGGRTRCRRSGRRSCRHGRRPGAPAAAGLGALGSRDGWGYPGAVRHDPPVCHRPDCLRPTDRVVPGREAPTGRT